MRTRQPAGPGSVRCSGAVGREVSVALARCVNGHEVLAGDRFCGRCGWAVPAHCPYGHPAQPDHVYCKECGAAVGQAAQPALVTGVSSQPPVAAPPPGPPPAPLPGTRPEQPFGPLPGPSSWSPPAPGPGGFADAPRTPRRGRWGSGARTGAVVAGLLVLVAAGLGIAAGATGGRGQGSAASSVSGVIVPSSARRAVVPSFVRPATTPSTVFPSTTEPSIIEPPSTQAPAGEAPSTAPPAAPASRALSGLGPLVGDWNGHGGGVHIGADGEGQATFRAYRFCTDDPTPPCDTMNGNAIIDGGHAQFRLTAARAPGAATGQVTSSDDPQAFQPGFAMTLSLTAGDVVLVSSSPTAQSVAYCGSRAAVGACGA